MPSHPSRALTPRDHLTSTRNGPSGDWRRWADGLWTGCRISLIKAGIYLKWISEVVAERSRFARETLERPLSGPEARLTYELGHLPLASAATRKCPSRFILPFFQNPGEYKTATDLPQVVSPDSPLLSALSTLNDHACLYHLHLPRPLRYRVPRLPARAPCACQRRHLLH